MNSPKQPSEKDWKFVEELQSPLHQTIHWERNQTKANEADLSNGAFLDLRFPDPTETLKTACADFKSFLEAGKISANNGFKIIADKIETDAFEAFKIEVSNDSCKILANDTEGIRRGLVFLEDEILRSSGPFLTLGKKEKKPIIKTRISRCFFGPVKRPPQNRDELADEVNYYPDEYLNRLAHEGINALWLTVSFKDLCPSELFPDHGKDSARRLAKLKQTANQCARYGIKIYVFCIEPWGFGPVSEYQEPLSYLENHPDLAGDRAGVTVYFCTSTEKGQKYLEDCANYIFAQIPALGGLIDINLGERPTHCYSSNSHFKDNNCPRCSKRKPWEVFADTTSAIARGIQKANPEAEMISWLYVPYMNEIWGGDIEQQKEVIREIAAHIPDNVTLQYNFESNGIAEQLGKERVALDYWLSYIGPSDIFSDCAKNAVKAGARASAKIQVGCSHEVATVPFLPVPGNLFKKYRAMHELGVSTVMQCWYFGNYPGLMNKAAGELSFAPFPADENEFLLSMAKTDWGKNAEKVVEAWKYFQEGYSNFPVNLSFTWYGPVHHSIAWPLHLIPVDQPISPSWKFTFPMESGDRIGECVCFDHTLEETLLLTEKMADLWEKGTKLLEEIEADYKSNVERALDIGLAKALGIQFRSAHNVFKFYALREELPYMGKESQLEYLNAMKHIAKNEIKNCFDLKKLCLNDSRLGFHSEAEGYKYFPAKLDWRTKQLEQILKEDFPAIGEQITKNKEIFPKHTGIEPQGKVYRCGKSIEKAMREKLDKNQGEWRAFHDDNNICFEVKNKVDDIDNIILTIEPCRLWPAQKFSMTGSGIKNHQNFKPIQDKSWQCETKEKNGTRTTFFTIPFACFEGFHKESRPMRINVTHNEASWVKKNPLPSRLRFGADNPADLGWLIFE